MTERQGRRDAKIETETEKEREDNDVRRARDRYIYLYEAPGGGVRQAFSELRSDEIGGGSAVDARGYDQG